MTVIWDQATYDKAYRVRRPDKTWIGYSLDFAKYAMSKSNDQLTLYIERANKLLSVVGLDFKTETVLVVGCGWNYLAQVMFDGGALASTVWGTDTSPYIQTPNKKNAETPSLAAKNNLLNIDISSPAAVADILAATGLSSFQWVVTEQVVESIDAVDLSGFLDSCDNLQSGLGGVVHLLSPLQYVWTVAPTTIWQSTDKLVSLGLISANSYLKVLSTSNDGLMYQIEQGWIDVASTELRDGKPHDITYGLRWMTLDAWSRERSAHYWLTAGDFRLMGGPK